MKHLIRLFVTTLLFTTLACNTSKKNMVATNDYVSPQVYIEQTLAPLPADSIPVSYNTKGVALAPEAFMPLIGQWVAVYDEGETLEFQPGKYVSFYQGQKVIEEHMTYYQNCPESCAQQIDSKNPCFILASEYNQTCFEILRHNEHELELNMMGSNESLSYQRKH